MDDTDQPINTAAAERAVIGACITSPDSYRWAQHLEPDDFSSGRFGVVWATLRDRRTAGEPTDIATMDGVLGRTVKGYQPGDVFGLVDGMPAGGTTAHWADQIAEGSKRRQLIAAAARARQNATDADLADALAIVKRDLEDIGKATSSDLRARPLARVLEESDAYDWLIPDILERQERAIFTGGEGGGKTTLVRQLAICSAAGIHPFTFQPIDPVRVLIIDAENTERQWRRATRRLVATASQQADRDVAEMIPLACTPRLDITRERDMSAIHRLIDDHQPDLLFIGPLYKLVPRAIQSDDDAAPVLAALDTLRDRGLALVMEAHAGHGQSAQGQRDLRPRGSSALLGWPEFGMGLRLDTDHPPYQANPGDFRTRKVELVRWRGDRDQRSWPSSLYASGTYPWEP
ncbi:AAA family ATPase [Brachybacterium subflavum]|uniref:AAA family ATPase n=1 Tax=Brachybacterium subflavum TaxID=2585206 RepID=UPI00126610C7|nr:AAA family ATPase [Brachybacterium subflavum]